MIYVCKQCGSRKTEQPFRSTGELLYTCALCIEKNKKKEYHAERNPVLGRDAGQELFSNLGRIRKAKIV